MPRTLEMPGPRVRDSAVPNQWRNGDPMLKDMRWSSALVVLMLVLAACQGGGGTGSSGGAGASASAAESTGASASAGPSASEGGGSGDPAADCQADELGCVEIPEGEPVHIAFWGVLSGPNASLGEDAKRGVEIAIDDRGGELLGHPIELSEQDGGCTPEGGATAAQALAADTTLVGLIGSVCSDETVGGIEAITNAGLTTISPSNTRPALTAEDRDETFAGYLRTAHNDEVQGAVAAQFAFEELGVQSAATIHDGSAYAEALQQVFADEFEALGGTITAQEAVTVGQTDMSPVLNEVAAGSPELLYFPIFTAEGGYIGAQVRDTAGLEDVELMGADGLFSADFVEAAGPNVEGMYLSSPDFTAFPGDYDAFLEKHQEKYGEAPIQIFHAHGYDAANILLNAIEQVALEGDDGTLYVPKGALREAVFATEGHEGLTGSLSCTPSGDCSDPAIAVYQITARETGGEWPPEAPLWSPDE
jgi:branched-chain amino acid transport system substrate-binding protein